MYLKNKKKSRHKNQQNLKKTFKHEANRAVLKNRSSSLLDWIVRKSLGHNKINQHHSKIPKLVLETGKYQMSAKKSTKSARIITILE